MSMDEAYKMMQIRLVRFVLFSVQRGKKISMQKLFSLFLDTLELQLCHILYFLVFTFQFCLKGCGQFLPIISFAIVFYPENSLSLNHWISFIFSLTCMKIIQLFKYLKPFFLILCAMITKSFVLLMTGNGKC